MLFFLVSFLSFLLLLIHKPLPLHLHLHLPSWVSEMRLLSVLLCPEFLNHSIQWLKNYKLVSTHILKLPSTMFTWKLKFENVGKEEEEEEVAAEAEMTVLDLPELALEMILDRLNPAGLLNMACVCTTTRKMCRSDHLWERHFREKWGRIMGRAARREWESYSASLNACKQNEGSGLLESLSCVWPCSWFVPKRDDTHLLHADEDSVSSVMAWYLGLERGRFWFPAQVYNREQNGHVGFMLSCYDAELSYDSQTDTFRARYPPHGQRPVNVEEGVQWDRLRAPPVDTPAHDLHISDCLNELQPGDHIEIQWRRNKKSPYGWWYGVVGHLESCDGEEHHCRCYNSDTVTLEFNQYSPGSRWRRTDIDRKDHREEGNESDGFYGGIRKLYDKDEIAMWRRLWPTEVLE